eukprot:8192786-Lingulodinium_polyedra.AAC.1
MELSRLRVELGRLLRGGGNGYLGLLGLQGAGLRRRLPPAASCTSVAQRSSVSQGELDVGVLPRASDILL